MHSVERDSRKSLRTSPCSLTPFPAHHPDLLLQTSTTLSLCLITVNSWPHQPGDQIGDLHYLFFPSNQCSRLILNSVVDHQLWPLLHLCPSSQQTWWHTLLSSPPAHPSRSLCFNSSPFLSVSSQHQLETYSTWNPQWPCLAGSQKHFLPGNLQPPLSPRNQRG